MKTACYVALATIIFTSITAQASNRLTAQPSNRLYPTLLSKEQLMADKGKLGGVYYAYPNPLDVPQTKAPEGYKPFYISHYGRHGSRYQPNDARYADTRKRLRDAKEEGRLTEFGNDVLARVEILCDSCLGHGGLLTSVGERQHDAIARRMMQRYGEVFRTGANVSARASVVKRCGQSMQAFINGMQSIEGHNLNICAEVDSSYMEYLAYDTPEMRQLASKENEWWKEYQRYIRRNVDCTPLMRRLFSDASDMDTLQTTIDLYWLVVGMQNLDMPFTLDDVFTPDELLRCWQCVNYRMYVCNANAPFSRGIPAKSASSLLSNIIESADAVIDGRSTDAATLRFGHDSNLLRLLALMRVHNCINETDDLSSAWTLWQECQLSPMAANLQMIFYRNDKGNILVKILLNENETVLDAGSLATENSVFYDWKELRHFFQSQLSTSHGHTDFIEPVQ